MPPQNQVILFLIAGLTFLGLHLALKNPRRRRREYYVDSIDGYMQAPYDGSDMVNEDDPNSSYPYRDDGFTSAMQVEKGIVEGYASTPFLTGTYADSRGIFDTFGRESHAYKSSRLDMCIDECLGWLDLPPFDRKTGYCIKGCIRQFRS